MIIHINAYRDNGNAFRKHQNLQITQIKPRYGGDKDLACRFHRHNSPNKVET